ncbi:MAG: hypothetical protein ACOC44_07275 [Promethearchaeia archaeon]
MDFEDYSKKFMKLSGIVSVGIVDDLNSPKIFLTQEENIVSRKNIEDLLARIKLKVLDLSVRNLKLKMSNQTLLCILEEKSLLLLLYNENKTDLNKLKSQVDKFLNNLLIGL